MVTESAIAPDADVVDVAEGSSTPVGTAGVDTLKVTAVFFAGTFFFAGVAFLGAADFGRPGFFFTGVDAEVESCVAAAFLATDLAGTAFFCAGFFFAATLEVDAFLFDGCLLLILGMIAME